ncbi:MAG: hypothetical protein P9M14_12430 [Candidatus Alcyoniella australis]|nr:hypothetical protein [Candidatus Alcyoniella australis]
MKRLLIALALVVILSSAAHAGIEGTYICKGTNPGGTGTYEGTVSIVKNNANYNVTWNIGAQVYVGVGILEGERFSVGYADVNQGWFGVVVYTVSGNKLRGAWAMHGDNKNGTEELTRR